MSARYSTSPSLHLTIGKSRLRLALYCALCLATGYAIWLLNVRGHGPLGLLLTPLVGIALWHLRRDPMVGAELGWVQGLWTLERAGVLRVIYPGSRSTLLPGLIYLAFTEQFSGRRGHIWLFVDSASAQLQRRLRVRLTLLR